MASAKKPKKKPSALARAQSRRLQMIGMPKLNPEQITHALYHAEERGEVERETQEDGSWVWIVKNGPDGGPQRLAPTPEMVAAYERFARGEGHDQHH